MNINRRKFLQICALSAGALVVGGGALYALTRDSEPDILEDHYEGTEKALVDRFGKERARDLMVNIHANYTALAPEMPYIGGEGNMFTEWLIYGVYYLAVYRVLKAEGHTVEEAGKVVYDTFEKMAAYPKWLIRLVGRFKYGQDYVQQLKQAAANTLLRRYPGDWVATFIEGDGQEFDYGLDITECGICKFYHQQGADELAPYMCLSDYVVSKAFDRGLVRHKTLAEGAGVCDFRFKAGRETYVYPLRDGWPPKFRNS